MRPTIPASRRRLLLILISSSTTIATSVVLFLPAFASPAAAAHRPSQPPPESSISPSLMSQAYDVFASFAAFLPEDLQSGPVPVGVATVVAACGIWGLLQLSSTVTGARRMVAVQRIVDERIKRRGSGAVIDGEIRRPRPDEPFFPPGLYNLGNTCFMNSVIQAVCSLPPLFEFLRDRCYQYYSADVPDPADGSEKKPLLVTEALLDLVVALNSMDRTRRVLKPSEFIAALAATSKGNRRLMCYEQQDAHELLQILSSSLTDEEAPGPPLVLSLFDLDSLKAEAPGLPLSLKRADSKPVPPPGKKTQLKRRRSRTLVAEGFTLFPNLPQNLRNPFTGLLAHSMSCLVCGYRPEVRHDTFDNISLAVPHASATSVQALLNSYVSHEDIEGYACARCILIATVQSISKDIEVLKEQIAAVSQKAKKETSDQLRNKRKDDLRILLNELRDQEQNRRLVEYAARFDVEKKLPVTIKKAKVTSAHAQKQILIAHPPQVLCLHMQRSVYTPSGVVYKNNCRVKFDPILDLTPFCSYMGGSIANASPVAAERLMEIQAELERRRAALRNAREGNPGSGSGRFGNIVLSATTDADAPPPLEQVDADSSDNQQSQAESSKPTTQRSKRRSSGNKRSGLRGGAATNDLDGDDDAERSSLTLDGVNSLVEGSDSSIAVPNGDTATANEKEESSDEDMPTLVQSVTTSFASASSSNAASDPAANLGGLATAHSSNGAAPTGAHLITSAAAPTTYATPSPPRHLYRLHAVVLHHGSHDSGHFVTFRRCPHPLSEEAQRMKLDPVGVVAMGKKSGGSGVDGEDNEAEGEDGDQEEDEDEEAEGLVAAGGEGREGTAEAAAVLEGGTAAAGQGSGLRKRKKGGKSSAGAVRASGDEGLVAEAVVATTAATGPASASQAGEPAEKSGGGGGKKKRKKKKSAGESAARGESKAKGGGGEEGVRWFRISDDHVDIVTDVRYEVFEAGGANAYMLFYERI